MHSREAARTVRSPGPRRRPRRLFKLTPSIPSGTRENQYRSSTALPAASLLHVSAFPAQLAQVQKDVIGIAAPARAEDPGANGVGGDLVELDFSRSHERQHPTLAPSGCASLPAHGTKAPAAHHHRPVAPSRHPRRNEAPVGGREPRRGQHRAYAPQPRGEEDGGGRRRPRSLARRIPDLQITDARTSRDRLLARLPSRRGRSPGHRRLVR